MIVERLDTKALSQGDGAGEAIGCDECGTADAVWGIRFEFVSDSVDEPYTVALCHPHFDQLRDSMSLRLAGAVAGAA